MESQSLGLRPVNSRIVMICLQRASTLCSQCNGCCCDFLPVEAHVPSCGDVAKDMAKRKEFEFTPVVNEQSVLSLAKAEFPVLCTVRLGPALRLALLGPGH